MHALVNVRLLHDRISRFRVTSLIGSVVNPRETVHPDIFPRAPGYCAYDSVSWNSRVLALRVHSEGLPVAIIILDSFVLVLLYVGTKLTLFSTRSSDRFSNAGKNRTSISPEGALPLSYSRLDIIDVTVAIKLDFDIWFFQLRSHSHEFWNCHFPDWRFWWQAGNVCDWLGWSVGCM